MRHIQVVIVSLDKRYRLTLPQRVQELLGVSKRGDVVGFLLDQRTGRVTLKKVKGTRTKPVTR